MSDVFNEIMDVSGLSRKKWEYEIERSGYEDLLCFGTADIDYHSPKPILDAIRAVADKGHLGYPHISSSYYGVIQNWLKRSAGWSVDTSKAVIPHVGVYMSCITAIDAFSEVGDEVVIQTPVHPRFAQLVRDNGRTVITNPLKRVGDCYEMDYENLKSVISQKTKILWLCNPHNPVGRAWTKEELLRLGDICKEHEILILSDDIYCGMVYPGYSYVPIASLSKDLADISISCYSPSKCYNTTGANQSFVIIENETLREKYKKSLHKTDLDYAINLIGLAITEAAYSGKCDKWLCEFMEHIASNHNFLVKFVSDKMPGVGVISADSTYFGWLDFRNLKMSSGEIVEEFLHDAHIVVNSGTDLGEGGEGYIRINLACPKSVLAEGLERMAKTYDTLLMKGKNDK